MKAQEIFDELEQTLKYKLQQDETTSEQIIQCIREKVTELTNILEANEVNYLTIQDYMSDEFKFLTMKLAETCEERTDDIANQVINIIDHLPEKLDEESKVKETTDENIEQESQFNEIETNDANVSRMITSKLEDFIMDIRQKTAAIMDAHGLDYSRIDEVVANINAYMNNVVVDTEEEVYNILSKNREKIIEIADTEYKKAMESVEKDPEETFRKNLDAGISLEQQKEFVENISEKEDNEKKEKPKQLGTDIELI